MVLASHVIFGAYGFWLPNDPRGSNSDLVGAKHLQPFGPARKVFDRRSHASDAHNRALRAAAKRALLYAPVIFNDEQRSLIGRGFARCIERTGCTILACAIMKDHAHLVIARHRYHVEQLVTFLKGDATRALADAGLHPFNLFRGKVDRLPSPWGLGLRKVFLSTPGEIASRVRYVEENPIKARESAQTWDFVRSYIY